MAEELSAEETEIYEDLAQRAGVIAQRLLSEGNLAYLDDLPPEAARELLRSAWRIAAEERFRDLDISELYVEIDAMVDSIVMTGASPSATPLSVH